MLAEGAGREAAAVVVSESPEAAAAELARYVGRVIAIRAPEAAGRPQAAVVAARVAALAGDAAAGRGGPSHLLLGATPEGRDAAGMLAVLLDLGVIWNADTLTWNVASDAPTGAPAGPRVESTVIGGRIIATSALTEPRGIVIVRPGTVPATEAPSPGAVESADPAVDPLPAVRIVETVPAGAVAASIEEARVVVVGGRGVGGPDGFGVLRDLADELGGAVGATRAAVDSGWVPFSIQVGQTGRTIRPAAYVGFGVSGAIQHTVGMRTAGTIVVVNRDSDAPFAELADLFVVADLTAVAPALLDALRARARSS